jgi:hypothetical protein
MQKPPLFLYFLKVLVIRTLCIPIPISNGNNKPLAPGRKREISVKKVMDGAMNNERIYIL